MITWEDKSGSRGQFFEGSTDMPVSIESALDALFGKLGEAVLETRAAERFDLLMLEVNCSTGMLIACATTQQQWQKGRSGGCSLRVQSVQDIWYDLEEAGVSDSEFDEQISQYIDGVGVMYRELVRQNLAHLQSRCDKDGFEVIVFGEEPGKRYLSEKFAAYGQGRGEAEPSDA